MYGESRVLLIECLARCVRLEADTCQAAAESSAKPSAAEHVWTPRPVLATPELIKVASQTQSAVQLASLRLSLIIITELLIIIRCSWHLYASP